MFYKNFHKIVSLVTFGILLFSVALPSIATNAQKIGIKPYNPNGERRGVFRYIVNAGDTIKDSITVANNDNVGGDVIVKAKDSMLDSGGQITFIENDTENQATGKWISLSKERLTLTPNSVEKVDFEIKVPNDTKSGEYTAGITSLPVSTNQEGSVDIKVRTGVTIYITVKGDLKLDNDVKNLTVINPETSNFIDELDKRGYIDINNMVVKLEAKNLGNIFSVLDGKLKITQPNGKLTEIPVKRTLNLNDTIGEIYIETRLEYLVGETKVDFEYTSSPYNFKDEVQYTKTDRSNGKLNFSFNLTQEKLDEFKKIKADLAEYVKNTYKGREEKSSSSSSINLSTSSSNISDNKIETKAEDNSQVIIGSLIIALLVLIIVYLITKEIREKSKKENMEKESKIEDKAEEKKQKIEKTKIEKKVSKTKKK